VGSRNSVKSDIDARPDIFRKYRRPEERRDERGRDGHGQQHLLPPHRAQVRFFTLDQREKAMQWLRED
jgi:hypothetical protein